MLCLDVKQLTVGVENIFIRATQIFLKKKENIERKMAEKL